MKETAAERLTRLQAHAEAMRQKRAEKHVCPPHDTDDQITKLKDVLDRVAPDNIAPIPISMAEENGRWTVDIHVKRRRITEYELTGEGDSLAQALTNARRMLSRETSNQLRGAQDATVYGYEI